MVNVRKRGKSYQYYFEIAPVDGKRKRQVKSISERISFCYSETILHYYNSPPLYFYS